MSLSFSLILLFLALICFVLSAINVPSARINLQSMGLALWVLSIMVAGR